MGGEGGGEGGSNYCFVFFLKVLISVCLDHVIDTVIFIANAAWLVQGEFHVSETVQLPVPEGGGWVKGRAGVAVGLGRVFSFWRGRGAGGGGWGGGEGGGGGSASIAIKACGGRRKKE